jgi:hypothetical protein
VAPTGWRICRSRIGRGPERHPGQRRGVARGAHPGACQLASQPAVHAAHPSTAERSGHRAAAPPDGAAPRGLSRCQLTLLYITAARDAAHSYRPGVPAGTVGIVLRLAKENRFPTLTLMPQGRGPRPRADPFSGWAHQPSCPASEIFWSALRANSAIVGLVVM